MFPDAAIEPEVVVPERLQRRDWGADEAAVPGRKYLGERERNQNRDNDCIEFEYRDRSTPMRSDGSEFSGVAQPCTAPADAWDVAILPWAISAQRRHVRCNGLLGG